MFSIIFISAGISDMPEYAYDDNYNMFAFKSLLTREESIQACGKVRTECNKVGSMPLFHIPTTKPMRLEEFEQTQSQATSQVCIEHVQFPTVFLPTALFCIIWKSFQICA